MNLDVTKTVLGVMASIGASAIVGNAIKISTPDNVKVGKQACMIVGGLVLSSLVGNAASKHVHDEIDEGLDMWSKIKAEASKVRASVKKPAEAPKEEPKDD